jgi:hypothetical protein
MPALALDIGSAGLAFAKGAAILVGGNAIAAWMGAFLAIRHLLKSPVVLDC